MSESKYNQIMHAQIHWSDQSEPFSPLFDDLYFNTDQGIEESRYVFLQGNHLTQRWLDWHNESFCIAETGFGTGLNFLLTSLYFDQFLKDNPDSSLKHLFFTSFEKYPLTFSDLQKALTRWPTLAPYIAPLLAQYPLSLVGCHRIHLPNITLDLWFGDVHKNLPNVYIYEQGLFDCWYLDGFAPSKNPDMWNEQLFNLMANSSKLNATLATFTAAGFVKRGLQSAGFEMTKRKGYGKKREMLIGTLTKPKRNQHYAHHFRDSKITEDKEVAIIGGGISSACLSLALIARGYKVTLYCKDKQLAIGASGNQQGALYPLLNEQHDPLSQLFANSFLYARNYVEALNKTHPFDYDFSGLLQLYYDNHASKKLDKIIRAGLPKQLVTKVDSQCTDELANIDIGQSALFYPLGGWLSPVQMVRALFEKATLSTSLSIKYEHELLGFDQKQGKWVCDFGNHFKTHSILVLTTAMHSLDFKQCEALPLSAARGQVTHIDSNPSLQHLKMTLCHEGYLTPLNNNKHCMGASFVRHTMEDSFSPKEQLENKNKLAKCIKDKRWIDEIKTDHQDANIGIRCTTRDHFPYMGALPDYEKTKQQYASLNQKPCNLDAPSHQNLFILTGLGSRGLNTGPLLAESLASQINKEPLPLSIPILNALQCNRQWINYLKKGKPLKL
ncbi:bifunctional tRNA (5-methylaminomethyl-2-thiouridine)(34)-methyltransferase MnmD/FAD-dependent 5-carboxymethylaminomethyl-2-thiouridine(34) oxidoreductase MnmC [Psychromonas sp. psych-6C06]|uniref:bifunctional tRNA (5-methylaminomethyl-2-thiouridine)(34)-methyltransferase MnmD/FAD-dependent 5-carboxymethylaminomethyl-2-thiouridine(34) oxidoreductase MnmC n=1 Tax=Psychromonas sp. psych-6C06 TaxID=2058089 RepID=UPI000C348242|nr:bifunctional tRNA (5-methylaminomethyl-2-thiouridine)(34)-methyltransferase MnmD/FAD-dependent 5-carboxymethylaminomethyl-2-thiouridine(34) oxidoreductase MnmC [Psychromonas sp. psych-6C06]PKF63820.1 bifunctional tRNA (5-methylaminomethyl-2-thiouridine)(34)-methyltransferase MnmD/FAD-dependent 5-carboxymethylaminomethyl-2-thiouridine(34) oxidoreductase MnmC [Psychromonas sp. psych-6C06]